MDYILFALPKADVDLTPAVAECCATFRRARHQGPSVALAHPSQVARVRAVLPFVRTRAADEPIPQPGDLLLGAT